MSRSTVLAGLALLSTILAWPVPESLAAAAAPVGTIHATLDGQARTWHVLDSGDVPGATWMQLAPGRYSASVTGFEPGASESGAAEGSQVTISFEYSTGDGGMSYRLPVAGAAAGEEPASVRLMPAVRDLSTMHVMQHGTVFVDDIEVRDRRTFSYSGRFSGELRDDDGEPAGMLEDGTFQIDQAILIAPH